MLILNLCSPIRWTSWSIKTYFHLCWGFRITSFFLSMLLQSSLLCYLWLKGKRFFLQCRFRSFWIYPISYLRMEIVTARALLPWFLSTASSQYLYCCISLHRGTTSCGTYFTAQLQRSSLKLPMSYILLLLFTVKVIRKVLFGISIPPLYWVFP